MAESLRGERNGNTWTKTKGWGQKHGFDLKQYYDSKGIRTLPDIFEDSANKFEDKLCMGTRKIVNRIKTEENGKTVEKLVLGDYEWQSYKNVQDNVLRVAAGLRSLGFEKGQNVIILAETRADWFITAIGCLRLGLKIVTLYTSLPDEGLFHGIDETEVDTIFTSYDILPRLAKILPKCKLVNKVIVFEDSLDGVGSTNIDPIKLLPFQTFLNLGEVNEINEIPKPLAEDNAVIMYTSGSTGTPKGVEITHDNIYHSLVAYIIQADLNHEDRYIAYLPLAHIMELITEMALMALGVTVAYSSPFTLTDSSPKVADGCLGDAKLVKPTSITAVPLILDRIIKLVKSKVEKQGKIKSRIFNEAVKIKQANGSSLTSKILDFIIFSKVKAELGGCVKMMVVGSAPLSPQTHTLIRTMFSCTLQAGYGCTETTACITSMDSDSPQTGHVGPPNPFVQIRLEDWEEGHYRLTDKPRPRGEIVVGGNCVAHGYFKLIEETAASFFVQDGVQWFRTGDIGEFDDTGVLYIIDRKKDLIKLKHGEYISLGNVESKLKTSHLIENVCVVADPMQDCTVAIIIPLHDALLKIANNLDKNIDDLEKMCVNPDVKRVFLEKLISHGKKCGLSKWDIPQALYLTLHHWTPDNGLVTAALKIKRTAIHKEYNEQIEDMYNSK